MCHDTYYIKLNYYIDKSKNKTATKLATHIVLKLAKLNTRATGRLWYIPETQFYPIQSKSAKQTKVVSEFPNKKEE